MFTILCILAALMLVIGLWHNRRIRPNPDPVGNWPRRVQVLQTSDGQFHTDAYVAHEHQRHLNHAYWRIVDDRLR